MITFALVNINPGAKVFLCLILTLVNIEAKADRSEKDALLEKVFSYTDSINLDSASERTQVYTKFKIKSHQRNFLLWAVPTMYSIAKGKRSFFGESYSTLKFKDENSFNEYRHYFTTNVPHNRKVMRPVTDYLTPDVYRNTMFKKNVLSPFSKSNKKYYWYKVVTINKGETILFFKPKINNTQLIRGHAVVDRETGRLEKVHLKGEFDMIKFDANVEMNEEGFMSLLPKTCKLNAQFNCLGNKISADYYSFFNQKDTFPDTIRDIKNRTIFDTLRAVPLNKDEAYVYFQQDSTEQAEKEEWERKVAIGDTMPKKKKYFWQNKVWETIGENLFNSIGTNFGERDNGWLNSTAIFNPQYFSYSDTKGVTFRYDIRFGYAFTSNRNINTRIKIGYRTKLHRFFLMAPFNFDYNLRRNGRLQLYVSFGNIIYNGSIHNEFFPEGNDTIDGMRIELNKFVDSHVQITNDYDISDYVSFRSGVVYHHRKAVRPEEFNIMNIPKNYQSLAIYTEWSWRPWAWTGPKFAVSYEGGVPLAKGKKNLSFQKIEFDAMYKWQLKSLCSLSLRAGAGGYLQKSNNYFLDYRGFYENNLPGGWNDDWSGDFQLLDYSWYNSSNYYARANVTYERPFILTAWIPFVGHFIESERVYVNALSVQGLSPYFEYGYGFTTRFFSMGVFGNLIHGKFGRLGFRFTFELFSRW